MSRLSRRLGLVMIVLLSGTGMAACGEKDEIEKALLANIDRTARLSGRFAYLDEDLSGTRIEVVGLIEDDLRYKARLLLDGEPIWNEVVSDDAVADQFLQPEKVLEFSFDAARRVNAGGPGAPPGEAAPTGSAPAGAVPFGAEGTPDLETLINVVPPTVQLQLKALFERRWVVDPFGAPSLVVAASDRRVLGTDPFFDALTVFDYTRKAVDAAEEVVKYDKESLEPTYKPEDDPFPKPDKDAGVARYDLKEPPLPTNAASSTGAVRQIQPPTAVHFRKMAIYVKGNRVIEIREEIDIQRKLKDFARNYDVKFRKGMSAEGQVEFALEKINELNRATTNPPLRVRQMTAQFRDLEDPSITVELPEENVVEGSLFGIIPNRGRPPKNARGVAASGQSGGASPASPAPEPTEAVPAEPAAPSG